MMGKARLIDHVFKISEMGHRELNDRAMAISMSDIDLKAKNFLNKAIELRREELELKQGDAVLVVSSEIDPGEI